MRTLIHTLLLGFYTSSGCLGQTGVPDIWTINGYTSKHTDIFSAQARPAALPGVTGSGIAAGALKRYGLEELDVY
jgi:hypothetical protein